MSNQTTFDLLKMASDCFDRGEYQAAIAWYQQAVGLAHQRGEHNNEMQALSNLSAAQGNLGLYKEGIDSARRLLVLARRVGDQDQEMRATLLLTSHLSGVDLAGHWSEIRPLLLDGLQLARQLNNHYREIYYLAKLGEYATRMGEQEQAHAWLQDALTALRPDIEGESFWRWHIYLNLSLLAQQRDDSPEALHYAEMSLGTAREHGNPDFVAHGTLHLARVQRWRGELSEALTLTEEALATWRRLNIEFRIVEATALKVQSLVDLGLRDKAQTVYQELLASGIKGGSNYFTIGLRAYKDLHDLDGAERAYRLCLEQEPKHASAWNNLACVLYDKDETDEAVRCWRESLKLRREDAPSADNLAGLALGLWTQGHHEEAVKIFRQALDLEPRYADPIWLAGEPFWSQKAIAAVRPLIAAANATLKDQSTGETHG